MVAGAGGRGSGQIGTGRKCLALVVMVALTCGYVTSVLLKLWCYFLNDHQVKC